MTAWTRFRPIAVVAVVVIAVDQLTKNWAVDLGPRSVDLVGSLRLRLAYNTGMAFSQGEGRGAIIAAAAMVIVAVMLWLARSVESRFGRIAIGLVIGGALGNIADRLFRSGAYGRPAGFLGGAVVDFIDAQWWPVFNVADSCVVVGGIVVALFVGREKPADESSEVSGVSAPTTEASAGIDG